MRAGDLTDKINALSEAGAGSAADTIAAIQDRGKKIAVSTVDKNKIYYDVDGTVWLFDSKKNVVNNGPVKKFIAMVKSGEIKAKLVNGSKSEQEAIL